MSIRCFWIEALWTCGAISVLCIHCINIYLTSPNADCGMLGTLSGTWSTGSSPSTVAQEQPLGQAGCHVAALMGSTWAGASQQGIPTAGQQWPCWRGVMGERLRFGKLPGMDEAQAKEAAATTSLLQLSPLLPLPHPEPVFPCAENVFVLPVACTSGCWGREAGVLFLIPPGAQSSLILARSELLKQRRLELSAETSVGGKPELVGFALKIK